MSISYFLFAICFVSLNFLAIFLLFFVSADDDVDLLLDENPDDDDDDYGTSNQKPISYDYIAEIPKVKFVEMMDEETQNAEFDDLINGKGMEELLNHKAEEIKKVEPHDVIEDRSRQQQEKSHQESASVVVVANNNIQANELSMPKGPSQEPHLSRAQLNKKYVPLKRRRNREKSENHAQKFVAQEDQIVINSPESQEKLLESKKESLMLVWYAPVLSYSGYGSEALEFFSGIWRALLPPYETETNDRRPSRARIARRLQAITENLTFPIQISTFRNTKHDQNLHVDDDDDDDMIFIPIETLREDSSAHQDNPSQNSINDRADDQDDSSTVALPPLTVSSFACYHHGDEQKQQYPSFHTAEYFACANLARGLALTSPTAVEPNWHIFQPHPSRMIVVCHSNQGMWSLPKPDFSTISCPPVVHPVLARVGRTMFETDRVPLSWFRRLEQMDELWVPTEFHQTAFLNSFVEWKSKNNNESNSVCEVEQFAQKLRVIPEPIDTELWRRPDLEYSSNYLAVLVEDRTTELIEQLEKNRRGTTQTERDDDELDLSQVESIEENVIKEVEEKFRIPVDGRNTRNRLHALTILSGIDVSPDYTIDDPILGPGPSIFRVPGEDTRDQDDDEDCDDRILNLHRKYEQRWDYTVLGEKIKLGPTLREFVLGGDMFEMNAYRLGDRSIWSKNEQDEEDIAEMLKRSRKKRMSRAGKKFGKKRKSGFASGKNFLLSSELRRNELPAPPSRFDGDEFSFDLATATPTDSSSLAVSTTLSGGHDDEWEDEEINEDEDLTVVKKSGGKRCFNSRVFLSTFKRERRKGWDVLVRAFVEQFTSKSRRIYKDDKKGQAEADENRNKDAPCLILHTNEFAEELPIDFPGTIDLFLEFLYAELPKSISANEEGEKTFIHQQELLQKKERDDALASMSQVWPTHFNSQEEFDKFTEQLQKQQQQQQQQNRPAVVDRVTAARLALHQRKEMEIDLKAHPETYHELCKLRCLKNSNRLYQQREEPNSASAADDNNNNDIDDDNNKNHYKKIISSCDLCAQLISSTDDTTLQEKTKIWRRMMRERVESHDSPIVLVTAKPLSFEEYRNLIMTADVSVLTTRGEGWGRPVQEAMALAVPSIVTNWSGPASFSHKNFSFLIPINTSSQLRTVPDDLWFSGHQWAEPSVSDVRRLLAKAENMPLRKLKTMGMMAREYVVEHLDSSVIGEMVVNATKELGRKQLLKKEKNNMK